jgi:hypothetical protein
MDPDSVRSCPDLCSGLYKTEQQDNVMYRSDERNNKCHFCNVIFKRHYNLKVHLKEQRCKSNLLNDWYKLNTILNKKETYEHQIKEHYQDDINEFTKNTNRKLTDEYKLLLKNEIIDELKEKIKSEIDEKSINKYKKEVEQNIKKNMKNIVLRKYKKNEKNTLTGKRGRPKKQKVIDILTESENDIKNDMNETMHLDTINNEDNTGTAGHIMINPINKLNLKDNIQNNKNLIIKYEKHKHNCSDDLLQSMLSEYIKNLILNKNNPENHCIKYIKKKPPTYNIKILDENNNKPSCIIKKLHECPVILYEPIYKIIKKQLKSLLYKSFNNNQDDDDDDNEEDDKLEYTNKTVHSLANQLAHHNGQKILMSSIKSVLHNNILFDKEMKFTF